VKYTPEFWKRARELDKPGVRRCQGCATAAGVKKGPHVRLVLINNDPTDLRAANLALMCTRCHPDPIYTREPYVVKPSRVTPKLFD